MTALRLAGAAAVALFALLVARFWHPVYGFTAFIQLDASNDATKIAAFRTYPVFVYRHTGGYDGMAYAQIAHHPALRAPELRTAVDALAYRARRILPSALAWALAGGDPAWIAQIYSALNPAAWLLLAALLWRFLPVRSWRGWACWCGALFSAGALASVRLALTDLIAALFLALLAARCERSRPGAPAALWGALAGLTRETAVLGLAALGPPWRHPRRLPLLLAAVGPVAAWALYVRWTVGPDGAGLRNFAPPLFGYFGKWREAVGQLGRLADTPLAVTTLLALIGLTVQVGWMIWRRRPADPWWRLGAAYLPLFAVLGGSVWEDNPGAAFRALLPLTLAANVLLARGAAPWLLIVGANLTVPAGLIAFRDTPYDSTELAAVRTGRRAAAAAEASGWYGAEHTRRHRWAWAGSAPTATVAVQTWGAADADLRATAFVRALARGRLEISDRSGTLWSGEIGAAKTPVAFRFHATAPRTDLVFRFSGPRRLEGPGADARALAFALYDLNLGFADGAAPH